MKKDTRVKHPAKSEWGMGRVLEDMGDGKVRIFFANAGEKVTMRQGKNNYVFVPKHVWEHKLPDNLFIALVSFRDYEMPRIYLILVSVWNKPNKMFVSRDYEGKKSKAEWGINITKANWELKNTIGISHQSEKTEGEKYNLQVVASDVLGDNLSVPVFVSDVLSLTYKLYL